MYGEAVVNQKKGSALSDYLDSSRMLQKDHWDQFYESAVSIQADPWLERHRWRFLPDMRILDIGCGNGANIPFLVSCSANVSACDYSEQAIVQVMRTFPAVDPAVTDLRDPLPYEGRSFDIIIADLSLHYFTSDETDAIVAELHRVMNPGGMLLVRVNSTGEFYSEDGCEQEIEPNLYLSQGNMKRYFDEPMIVRFFSPRFDIIETSQYTTSKYHYQKHLWEIVLMNKEDVSHHA